jgi:LmbE family N-acetylglucosaminyl deacetylase
VVSFDASTPGTPSSAWTDNARLRGTSALSIATAERIVVIAAHPDDETLGAGGLIARASAAGVPIEVVVVTDGAASHPGDEEGPRELRELREEESRRALSALAPEARITFLGYPDSGTPAFRGDIRRDIVAIVGGGKRTLLVAPWPLDRHRDHRVVGEISSEIAAQRAVHYPIWMWHWGEPDDEALPLETAVAIRLEPSESAAKRTAISQHRSQIEVDNPVLSAAFLENFHSGFEIFFPGSSHASAHFDRVHSRREDPWGVDSRWYERRKRALTLAALPDARYGSALEIGSSVGALTADLAARCDAVLGIDLSPTAVERAQRRLREHPNVTVERRDAVLDFPDGEFDLIVMSEVGYYFRPEQLTAVVARVDAALTDSGTVVTCHWRHPETDFESDAETVVAAISELSGIRALVAHVEEDFLLHVFSRDPRSVAAREGLV